MSESNSSVDSTTSEYMGGVEEVLFVDAKRGQGTHAITRAVYKAGRHVNERRNRRGLNDRPLWVGIIGAVKRGVCMARGQDGIINLHNRSLFSRTVSLFLLGIGGCWVTKNNLAPPPPLLERYLYIIPVSSSSPPRYQWPQLHACLTKYHYIHT